MLAAVLAVTVIAMAGVGYAAVDYYAQTTNDTNTLGTTYMELTQTNGKVYAQDFLTDLKFNTDNTASGVTKYTPKYTHNDTYGTDGTLTLALISDSLTLTLNSAKSEATTINMDVTATTLTPSGNLTYTMVLGTTTNDVFTKVENGSALFADGKWSFTGLKLDADDSTAWEVKLFIGGTASSETTGFSETCKFTFMAWVPEA